MRQGPSIRAARARRALVAGALGSLLVATSCREPTQVLLEARTNVPFHAGISTSFTVGGPGTTESSAPTTISSTPWNSDGFVGSLAVVPGTTDDASLSILLVMGVDRDPHECSIAHPQGCIFARRSLRYRPHEKIVLPVELFKQCTGVPCDADTTCNALGKCIPANVDPGTCNADGCSLVGNGDVDAAPPHVDAGDASDADHADGAKAEAASEAGGNDGGTGGARCEVGMLECPTATCNSGGGASCCETPSGATCIAGSSCALAARYCCSNVDCSQADICIGASDNATVVGVCGSSGVVVCSAGQIACPAVRGMLPKVCSPASAVSCCETSMGPICTGAPKCGAHFRFCCSDSDCGSEGPCLPPNFDPNAPRRCANAG